MTHTKTAFFAYGSDPSTCGEFIEQAIKEINFSGHLVHVKSWRQMSASGNFLISTILKEIENADLFCCDITNLNENVLFELGFAIGRKKPIWIIQDVTLSASFQKFKQFILLNNVHYTNYTSSKNIVTAFLQDKQYEKIKPLYDNIPVEDQAHSERKILFYLKSQIDQNYNQYIIEAIKSNKIPTLIDDSSENKLMPLSWYLSNIIKIPAVLVEFSAIGRQNHEIHNAKCSFIAGLALGLEKKCKFIAAQPYPSAIDYQEHLVRFTNLEWCKLAVEPYLLEIRNEAIELISAKVDLSKFSRKDGLLQKVRFGEMLAEHEADEIYDYYVAAHNDDVLVKSEYNIVVGRKGSGKTATFYYLLTKFSNDIRNIVVPIKPINFEIDGLIELISSTSKEFGKSYIVETVWKFIIYTEILRVLNERFSEKPAYSLSVHEVELLNFVMENSEMILPDLSNRLSNLFEQLKLIGLEADQSKFKMKIAEVLHHEHIRTMIRLIINALNGKGRLFIFIDNLDKNWRKGNRIEETSKFILGLLGVVGRIHSEIKGGSKKPNDIRPNLVVFLRSDIFKQVFSQAREPDKIEFTRLVWKDAESLFAVLDKRIDLLRLDKSITSEKFWNDLIVRHVNGYKTKQFIYECIIPRPRDLIYFMNSAKSDAAGRNHGLITENDIKSAYTEYSNWVFQSLMVENGITIEQLKSFLFELLGESSILHKELIVECMKSAHIKHDNDSDIEYFINHLRALSFLGIEVSKDDFYFDYGFDIDDKKEYQAKKFNSNRYKIHNAYMPYLECSDFVL